MKVYMPLAGSIVLINDETDKLTSQFEQNYVLVPKKEPLFTVNVKKSKEKKGYWLSVASAEEGEVHIGQAKSVSFRTVNFFLKALIQFHCLKHDILLLHGSALVYRDKGYMFLGPSGRGKSTILRLAEDMRILADDTAVLKKEGAGFFIYPSPFDRKKQPGISGQKVRLTGLYFLHQSTVTRVQLTGKGEARETLLACNFLEEYFSLIAQNPLLAITTVSHKKLMASLDGLIKTVPATKLFFRKDNSFMKLL